MQLLRMHDMTLQNLEKIYSERTLQHCTGTLGKLINMAFACKTKLNIKDYFFINIKIHIFMKSTS